MNQIEQMQNLIQDITIDLGNSNAKIIVDDKKIIENSNVQEVEQGTFGAYEVNSKHYLFGEGVQYKKNTNKIVETKKALLGKILYSIVDDNSELNITTLLPLSLYVENENKVKFQDLLKGDYTVTNANGYIKNFTVANVEVCAESFSSLVTDAKLLQEPIFLCDIGGVDLSGVYVNRTPVISQSFSSEKGMNIFYTELGKILTSKLLETYTDKDVELLFNKYNDIPEDIREIIDTFAIDYINNYIYKPLVNIGYKSLIHKLIFTGGGSIALQRYLSKDSNVTILPDAIWSNVTGARIISSKRAR